MFEPNCPTPPVPEIEALSASMQDKMISCTGESDRTHGLAGGISLRNAASCCVEALSSGPSRREALGPGSVNYWACQDGGTAERAAEQQEQCKEEPYNCYDELRGACQVRAVMPSIAGPD